MITARYVHEQDVLDSVRASLDWDIDTDLPNGKLEIDQGAEWTDGLSLGMAAHIRRGTRILLDFGGSAVECELIEGNPSKETITAKTAQLLTRDRDEREARRRARAAERAELIAYIDDVAYNWWTPQNNIHSNSRRMEAAAGALVKTGHATLPETLALIRGALEAAPRFITYHPGLASDETVARHIEWITSTISDSIDPDDELTYEEAMLLGLS